MINTAWCAGCYNDVYNGQLAKVCWNARTATMAKRTLISIDQAPPYKNPKIISVPTCYHKQRFVTADPAKIDANGYWK